MLVWRTVSLLCILFAISLSAFAQSRRSTAPPAKNVATVNGVPIPLEQYQREIENQLRMEELNGDVDGLDAITADTILIDLVEKELIRQEAERRRIVVTRQAAVDLLVKDPPEFIRPPFMDAKGVFHKDLFELVVRNPGEIVQMLRSRENKDSLVRQWRNDLEDVIRFVQHGEIRRRLMDALEKDSTIGETEIRNRYLAERAQIVGSFIRVLHSTVPDSLVSVTEQEARSWYAAHRDEYYAAPARMLGTVVFPVNPLPADSATHRNRIDSVRRLFQETPLAERIALVRAVQRGLRGDRFPENELVPPSRLTSEMLRRLAPASPGDLVGPFVRDDETIYLYVHRRAPVRDTVIRARHIIMSAAPGDSLGEVSAVELLGVIRDSIDNEQEFREGARYFSTDQSASNEGDLGWFPRGRMVAEFDSVAFSAPLRTVVGPFRTAFGHHLLWVDEKLNEGFELRELRFPLIASAEAYSLVRRDADVYRRVLNGELPADSVYREFAVKYPTMASDTSYVRRLDRYGDVLAPAQFGFGARVGEIAVLDLPLNRLMVTKLISVWTGGTPEYEEIPQYPLAHSRRKKQLDLLAPRMAAIADSITPDMLIGPLRELAPMAEVFLISDRSVTAPPDESTTLLDSLVASTGRGSVGGPVRGQHGFYFLRVLEKKMPTLDDYRRDRDGFAAEYRQRRRQQLLDDAVGRMRMRAEFVDLR